MRTRRSIWMACAGVVLASGFRAQGVLDNLDEWELDHERMAATGQAIFDRFAPDFIKENYDFATPEEIAAFFDNIHAALFGEAVEDLAGLEPRAHRMLQSLRANPDTQDYADWFEPRMDFIEMAAEARQAISAPTSPAPTPPTPASIVPPAPPRAGQKTLPPPPAAPPPTPKPIPPPKPPRPSVSVAGAKPEAARPPPIVEKARNRYIENKQVWMRKLAKRPPPARAAALLPDLKRVFRAEGVPPELVWQAEAESTFNPAARSPAGAAGLYQFMPATARQLGLRLSPEDERLDALKNARAAAKHLQTLHARFGNWPLVLAAYNCGESRVAKELRSRGGKTFDDIHAQLPAETRMYVPKIAALVQLRENMDLNEL